MNVIKPSNLDFLKELRLNNNREWFTDHKDKVDSNLRDFKEYFFQVEQIMQEHDKIEKARMYRIYRDVRFSKDKTPYKRHVGFQMSRLKPLLRGGYYIHIEPGNSFIAGGLFEPNKEDLLRLRQEIAIDDLALRHIIAQESFKKYFGKLSGEELKTGPRDFPKDHPSLDLLKKKQFYVVRYFDDKTVCSEEFLDQVIQSFMAMRPLFDYFSEVFTHDKNGTPLYE